MSSTQTGCNLQVLLQHKANLESSLEEEDLLKQGAVEIQSDI